MNANYNLSEKFLRMIKDDEYFDVTKEDVKILLKRMSHHYSRDDIIKMRIKYDAWIDDKEKRLMEEFGLSYDTHESSFRFHRASSCSSHLFLFLKRRRQDRPATAFRLLV